MSAESGIPSCLKITDGSTFRLSDFKTDDRVGHDKKSAHTRIRDCVDRMAILQGRLAAHGTKGILVVLQGMDTAGKDGAIRHAFSGLNPQGFHVTSFKTPAGPAEKRDDLWRVHLAVPARGEIAVFNRSHYEDVLIARVHPDIVRARGLDPDTPDFWNRRLADIRHFESYLTHQNVVILKLFLHISKDEQKKRILKRLNQPEKRWKFSSSDLAEREKWQDYTQAYEAAIQATATPEAPWHIIPSDHKWAARLMVAEALLGVMEGLHLKVPEEKLSDALRTARDTLLAESSKKP
ncbi:polyphosphate:nucleotide phosphotransferase [Gluconobacter thailandicus]|uniref:PPK2 family polyphosphate kinase n=1 Tax=Gluconobacter thailandicus TaxID=257438 RepID=UPI000776EF42|nr:PPK2 family polyphosphate kinase [Gluconobacter thailandicus]KXV34987.1 polyphosphate:nucleotide phosphotransferase [Gluconobacter thailandicus]